MKHTIRYPEGNVLLRNLNKDYPVISHGEGPYLFDQAGKKYFDGSGGALVTTLGHGNEEIAKEIYEQMRKVAYVNGMQFTSPAMEEAARLLAIRAEPLGLNKVVLLSSGSEAIEAALKFTRQLWVDRGRASKHQVISRNPGYHGNTLYALSASGRPHYKKVYGPLISNVLTVTAPYGYRAPVVTSSDPAEVLREYHEKGTEFYAQELEALIAKESADTISTFLFEPVSGSSTGGWIPPRGYCERMMEICKKHEILIIADEVMCGAGRTGTYFASEQFGLKPDVVVLGKGINAGLMPVSAVIVKQTDVDTMKVGSGGFMHAQTYMQSPSMAATALAVLHYLDRHQVLEKAKPVADAFQKALREQIGPLPFVGSVTGIGHIAGVEFVQDKSTKAPFPVEKKFAAKFVSHAQDLGLILWPNYGQADGINGDLVMLGPPLTMTMDQAYECVNLLKQAVSTFCL
jgi:adenosylmethionine-8-amino-7-oxononanoate aminotransferase